MVNLRQFPHTTTCTPHQQPAAVTKMDWLGHQMNGELKEILATLVIEQNCLANMVGRRNLKSSPTTIIRQKRGKKLGSLTFSSFQHKEANFIKKHLIIKRRVTLKMNSPRVNFPP